MSGDFQIIWHFLLMKYDTSISSRKIEIKRKKKNQTMDFEYLVTHWIIHQILLFQ